MPLLPISQLWDRVERDGEDSDVSRFRALMLQAEVVTKLAVGGLVACLDEDPDHHRYELTRRALQADGLGDWSKILYEILRGPAAQFLCSEAVPTRNEISSKSSPGDWQYEAIAHAQNCLLTIDPDADKLGARPDLLVWFRQLTEIRNRVSHGAATSTAQSSAAGELEASLRLVADNLSLFSMEWAHLHQNLSTKYRVSPLSDTSKQFEFLTRRTTQSFSDGVYVFAGTPRRVQLVQTTSDRVQFFFPNGNWRGGKYQQLCYSDGAKLDGDGNEFLASVTSLPISETQGLELLLGQGNDQCFGNVPPLEPGYVERHELQDELYAVLTDDRHPTVTLLGRGGIGKTWLSLAVLHKVAASGHFFKIVWFSARDIDLLPTGPKPVKPHVLSISHIAEEYANLMRPEGFGIKGFRATDYFAAALSDKDGEPTLFVIDNFETTNAPAELFQWLDSRIRLPNKLLITTRHRDFKGDMPVSVTGMTEGEARELIEVNAKSLGVWKDLSEKYMQDVLREADGHPYVVKVLLGEAAAARKFESVQKVFARRDDILVALFERTFQNLTAAGRRLFLTLCSWRSTVPVVALEAVFLRPDRERIDVSDGVEELRRLSFVEVEESADDGELFVSVPLSAFLFGQKKLRASEDRVAVEQDREWLLMFGPAQRSDVGKGLHPRMRSLFSQVAQRMAREGHSLESYLKVLEFVASKHPEAWLLLASLYEESGSDAQAEKEKECIRRYLEEEGTHDGRVRAWFRLGLVCARAGDTMGELQAYLGVAEDPGASIEEISDVANRINRLLAEKRGLEEFVEERRSIVRRIIAVFEVNLHEADADACSRLGWLYLNLKQVEKAKEAAELGLKRDPENRYCQRLVDRLSGQV